VQQQTIALTSIIYVIYLENCSKYRLQTVHTKRNLQLVKLNFRQYLMPTDAFNLKFDVKIYIVESYAFARISGNTI